VFTPGEKRLISYKREVGDISRFQRPLTQLVDKKLIVVCSASVVDPLVMTSYNPLVSALKTTFNADITLVALSSTFHMLPLAILCLFSGTISDLYHRPKMLMYGLFISSIGSLLGAISPNILVFLLSRSIQGIGSALIMPIALALIGDITPREALGKAMGFNGMYNALVSAGLGPLISGYLGEINWRLVSLYLCAYSLIIGILSRIVLRGLPVPHGNGSIGLVLQQIRRTVMNRNIVLLATVGFISMFAWAGIQPLISDMLSLPPLSMSKKEIGTIYSIVGFIGVLFAYVGGVLTDRFGPKRNMMFGLLMEILPVILLTFANSSWSYAILLAVHGGFMRVTQTSRSTLVVEQIPEARGSASSIIQFASFLGFASSPIVMSQIYVSSGMNPVYMSNALLLTVSITFIALIRMPRKNSGT
jgi:MFS family permease